MSYIFHRNRDQNFIACSVPPSPYKSLSKDFNELSFIHTYLGRKSFDFMIDAVEKASMKEIEIGSKQIYFAIKEVQDFLPYTQYFFDKKVNKDNYYFFNNAISEINEIAKKTIRKLKAKPGSQKHVKDLNILMVMFFEASIISSIMNELDLIRDIVKPDMFEEEINELISMQDLYPNLSKIKTKQVYLQEAKDSLKAQLEFDFYFDMNELMRVYDQNMDGRMWLNTQRMLDMNVEIIENNTYEDDHFDTYENNHTKDIFVKSMRSLEKTFGNGLIFRILGDAINISKEKFYNSSKLKISPNIRYERELEKLQNRVEDYNSNDRDKKALKDLIKNKSKYIEIEKENSLFQEKSVLISIAQENIIFNTINRLRDHILYDKVFKKENLVLDKKLIKDMFTGTIGSRTVVIYDFEENNFKAIQAYFIDKNDFKKLESIKERGKILSELSLMKKHFSGSFYNISSFIDEMKNKEYQIKALGKEFDITLDSEV